MSIGSVKKDLNVTTLHCDHANVKLLSTLDHVDRNINSIERDIFELQNVVLQNTSDTVGIMNETSNMQNDMIDLRFIQSQPWFVKSKFVYRDIQPLQWNDITVPDSSSETFIRFIQFDDIYTSGMLILPKAQSIGESRHVTMFPKSTEAVVYIGISPDNATRLSSFDIEWMVDANSNDQLVGHGALLSKTINKCFIGSTADSSSPGSCVVFPSIGQCYITAMYLDNNSGTSKIVVIFQKYQSTSGKTLPGFSFYGFQ